MNLPNNEPFWLDETMVKAMHDDQLAQHGGTLGIRDENLIAASLANRATPAAGIASHQPVSIDDKITVIRFCN